MRRRSQQERRRGAAASPWPATESASARDRPRAASARQPAAAHPARLAARVVRYDPRGDVGLDGGLGRTAW